MNWLFYYIFIGISFVVTLFFLRMTGRIVRQFIPRIQTLRWDNLKITITRSVPTILLGILLLTLRNMYGWVWISLGAVWISLIWDGLHLLCVLYYLGKLRQLRRVPDTFFYEVKVGPYVDWSNTNLANISPVKFWLRRISLPTILQPLSFILRFFGSGKSSLGILYGDFYRFLGNDFRYVDVFDDIGKQLDFAEEDLWSVPHLVVKDEYTYAQQIRGYLSGLLGDAVKNEFRQTVSGATKDADRQMLGDVLEAISPDGGGSVFSQKAFQLSSKVFLTNRSINVALPANLWETSCRLCQTTPSIIAATWKLYHFQEDVRLRFVTLFNVADLLQRLIGSMVLRMLADAGELGPMLAHAELVDDKQNKPVFPPNTSGDWNKLLVWALENSKSDQPNMFRRILLTPKCDFDESVDRLAPFWRLLQTKPQIPRTEQNVLARLSVLSLLRNKTIGHGSIGWKLQLRPAIYLSALHHFFLETVEEISKLNLGVVIYRYEQKNCKVVSVDQGLFSVVVEKEGNVCGVAMENPNSGASIDMYPYLRSYDGRLLIVDRFSKDQSRAVYVDYNTDKVAEPSFVELEIDPSFSEWSSGTLYFE